MSWARMALSRPGLLSLVLLLTFVIHLPSIDNAYVFDDGSCAAPKIKGGEEHEMVAQLRPLGDYFTSHYLRGASDSSRGYRPVTVLSYAVVYNWIGRRLHSDHEAVPQHLLNVLLQVVNTLLVYLLICRLGGALWPAILGALVFGVHAVHSGPVASIVGRGELLAFGFGALAAWLFLGLVRTHGAAAPGPTAPGPSAPGPAAPGPATSGASAPRQRALGLLLASVLLLVSVLLFLAYCSKESAVIWLAFLPCLLLARSWMTPEEAPPWRSIAISLVVSLPPFLAFLYLRHVTLMGLEEYLPGWLSNPLAHEDAATRVWTGTWIWFYGLYKVMLPFWLSCDYSPHAFTMVRSVLEPRFLVAATVLVALVGAGIWFARRQPLLFLAVASFFGFSLVTSNVPFALETVFAERLYYTPSLCLSFVVAWFVMRGWVRGRRRLLMAGLLAVWVLASAGMTWHRMGVWQDNRTLFLHDADMQPRSLRLLSLAASQHHAAGDRKTYAELVDRVCELEPQFPDGLLRKGGLAFQNKQYEAAERYFRKGLRSPLLSIIERIPDSRALHYDLGQVLRVRGRPREAVEQFRAALEVDPNYTAPRYQLMRALMDLRDLDGARKALAEWERIALQDELSIPFFRGLIAYHRGEYRKAAPLLEACVPRMTGQDMGLMDFRDWLALTDSLLRINRRGAARAALAEAVRIGGVPPKHRAEVERLRKRLGN